MYCQWQLLVLTSFTAPRGSPYCDIAHVEDANIFELFAKSSRRNSTQFGNLYYKPIVAMSRETKNLPNSVHRAHRSDAFYVWQTLSQRQGQYLLTFQIGTAIIAVQYLHVAKSTAGKSEWPRDPHTSARWCKVNLLRCGAVKYSCCYSEPLRRCFGNGGVLFKIERNKLDEKRLKLSKFEKSKIRQIYYYFQNASFLISTIQRVTFFSVVFERRSVRVISNFSSLSTLRLLFVDIERTENGIQDCYSQEPN